jgi:anti-anti-sigma factor
MGRAAAYEVRHWTAEPVAEVVVGSGELDLHAAPSLRDVLAGLPEESVRNTIFDFRETTFIDSTVIGVLAAHVKRTGGARIVSDNENVLRTLRISGMERVFEICGTLAEALTMGPVAGADGQPQQAGRCVPRTLELHLSPSPADLARARGFAAAAARRFGLDPQKRRDFTLAANEAVTNAIEHGIPCEDETIHLWVTEEDETLTMGVRDGGRFELEPAPPLDPLPERGRGLQLMSHLVDRVWFHEERGTTEVELSQRR